MNLTAKKNLLRAAVAMLIASYMTLKVCPNALADGSTTVMKGIETGKGNRPK